NRRLAGRGGCLSLVAMVLAMVGADEALPGRSAAGDEGPARVGQAPSPSSAPIPHLAPRNSMAGTRGTGGGEDDPPPTSPAPRPAARGSLVICGGGGLPESARQAFLAQAGGPKARLVVIPTASSAADGPAPVLAEYLEPWTGRGV